MQVYSTSALAWLFRPRSCIHLFMYSLYHRLKVTQNNCKSSCLFVIISLVPPPWLSVCHYHRCHCLMQICSQCNSLTGNETLCADREKHSDWLMRTRRAAMKTKSQTIQTLQLLWQIRCHVILSVPSLLITSWTALCKCSIAGHA